MDYFDPDTLGEALAILAERGDEATVLAGGTDVVVALLRGEIASNALVHIRRIQDLQGLTVDGRTVIGPTTTHWQLATNDHILREHSAVVDAALTVGGRQTQNVGTIGGNIANASPAADLVPALLVSDARVTLVSADGARELGLGEFITGRKQTARLPHELVSEISLERPPAGTGEAYVKLGRRRAMEVAVVGVAARVTRGRDGAITDARLAVCSVGPTAIRLDEAEQLLVGVRDHHDRLDDVGAAAEAVVQPIDDVRSSGAYRRRVLRHLIDQAVSLAGERTAG
jgi:carbon-monoxide dehydrogenase medium subunit